MAIEPIPLRRDDVDRHPPGLIGADIDRVLAGFGAPPAPLLTQLNDAWTDLVGPAAAEHCRPGKLVDGRLQVLVDDSAWASQMRWQQAGLLVRIDDLLPGSGIVELTIRVRPRG